MDPNCWKFHLVTKNKFQKTGSQCLVPSWICGFVPEMLHMRKHIGFCTYSVQPRTLKGRTPGSQWGHTQFLSKGAGTRVANITDFSVEVRNSENDPYFSRFLYGVLTYSDFLQILQFFDFFRPFFSEYKYIWRDRNTSFSKIRGGYDRARCSDNFNHKKVIIHKYRWAPVSDCIPAFAYCCSACDYKLDRIQLNFVKMKQEPRGYNKISDKLEFVQNILKIMWRFLQENFDDFRRKILTNDFWKKI